MSEEKLISLIDNYENFALVIHQFPDGDTISSSIALALALEKKKKRVDLICIDEIPKPFHFLPSVSKIKKDFLLGDYDLIIVIDCGDLQRTGFPSRIQSFAKTKKRLVNIDHHVKNDLHKLANINIVDYNASAVVEIVDRIIQKMNIEIDKNIATCLLTGLYTDTGGFRHSNTNAKTLESASRWLNKGAKLKQIFTNLNTRRSITSMKLIGLVLSRIKYNHELQITVSALKLSDMLKLNATLNDVAGIVNFINSIPEAKATILFVEITEGTIKASIRGRIDEIKVEKLAQIFGGRGHKKISGFTISGKIITAGRDWRLELYD